MNGYHSAAATKWDQWGALLIASSALLLLCLSPCRASAPNSEAYPEPAPDSLLDLFVEQGADFSYEIYQVRQGDTLANIAARFGVPAERIQQFNELATPEPEVGQALAIPLPCPTQKAKPVERLPLNVIDPRYVTVTNPSAQIASEPNSSRATDVLYQPDIGTQLIVNAERGDSWGVVMIDGSVGWIEKTSVAATDRVISSEDLEAMLAGGRPDIVQEAFRYLGTPYRYGGQLPHNIDCSLLVQTAFAAKGIRLPRTAARQFEIGAPVSYDNLLPGDRIYFVSRSGRINHTGIYIGNGRFIHASSRRGCVGVDALYDKMYWTRFIGARRS